MERFTQRQRLLQIQSNCQLILQLMLLSTFLRPSNAAQATTLLYCEDTDAAAADLSSASPGLVTVGNFSQLPGLLYGKQQRNSISWLLLLYNPFGGYWLDYAMEFGEFARRVAKWRHSLRIAALNTGTESNVAALHHYNVTGLPALFFIPRRATWGVTKAVQMPRDPLFLEDALLLELERFVPNLKPMASVTRLLHTGKSEIFIYLEEAPYGSLARRTILDHLATRPPQLPSLRIAWRTDIKLSLGHLRVTSYHRRRRSRRRNRASIGGYERRVNTIVRDDVSLVNVVESAVAAVATAAVVAVHYPHGRKLATSPTMATTTKMPIVAPTVAACANDAHTRPPSGVELRADVWRLLRSHLPACLASATTTSSMEEVWLAMVSFVRLMASALAPADPGGLAQPLLALAASPTIRRRSATPPGPARWRRLLTSCGVGFVAECDEDVAASCDRWRLLHALAAARVRTPDLQSVLGAARGLRLACPGILALPPALPAPLGVESPAWEALALWRLHNRARTRVFPPPRLCPGCRLASMEEDDMVDGEAGDTLEFLARWYRAAVEPPSESVAPPAQPPPQLPPQPPELLQSSSSQEAEDERPCVLRLLRRARVGARVLLILMAMLAMLGMLAMLAMLGCCAVVVCRTGGFARL